VVVTATTLVVFAASSLGQVLPDIPMLPSAYSVPSVSVFPAAHSSRPVVWVDDFSFHRSVSSASTVFVIFAHDLSDAYHHQVF
jgi:hypothetical protein